MTSANDLLLVKVGGGADIDLEGVATDLSGLHRPCLVLHGANALRDQMADRLGQEVQRVTGITGYSSTVSDDDAIDLLMATYAGIRNKRLVELLQRAGVDAIGLSGLDGRLVQGRRNPGFRVRDGNRKRIVRDASGKPQHLNTGLLRSLLAEGYTPVITVPIVDEKGHAINAENDDIAAVIASELGIATTVILLEAPGLLRDPEDETSRLPALSLAELRDLETSASGRFKRKLRALGQLLEEGSGETRVFVGDGRTPHPVRDALAGLGTTITRPVEERVPPEPDTADRAADHQIRVYPFRGIELELAEGATVTDTRGRSYVDCIAGHGALILGHGHPALRKVFRSTGGRGIQFGCPPTFGNSERTAYLEALARRLPTSLSRAFLCNSGTEAVEGAIKFSRLATGRTRILAATGAFHGRTLGALALTHGESYQAPFRPLLPDVGRVPFNDTAATLAEIDETVAAIVIEPVQGEGGVHPARPEYLAAVGEACARHGVMLVFDEVQTGFGRTGRMFAFEHVEVVPDLLCLAKGIAGGFPMGAVVGPPDLDVPIGSHGSTFGGSPFACALAGATLEALESVLPEVEAKGAAIEAAVADLEAPQVREIRRMGLMIGIEMRVRAQPVLERLQAEGLLALPAGRRTVRLLPPLTLSAEELDRAIGILRRVLSAPATPGSEAADARRRAPGLAQR